MFHTDKYITPMLFETHGSSKKDMVCKAFRGPSIAVKDHRLQVKGRSRVFQSQILLLAMAVFI